MNHRETVEMIAAIINRVLTDKGDAAQAIGADTIILGGDLAFDSLDLAAMVVEMDGVTGTTPFAGGFINFQTVGELAALYVATRN